MKNPILPELRKLKKQIEGLKKQKERKLALATSVKERNKLMMEIQELEVALKAPSKLKSFGKTFLRGLGITRRTFWRGIQKASRNLDKNAPEYRELSRGMTKKPMRPTSPMMDMYAPQASPYYSTTPRRMKSLKSKPLSRRMKTSKLKKRKQVKKMKRTSYSKKSKKPMNQMAWDLP